MEYRVERDSMGKINVPKDVYWGAQTQRSYNNFPQDVETMPLEVIHSLAIVKKAAALANNHFGKLDSKRSEIIGKSADAIINGELDRHFPLSVWQTGSGTQTNMNVNEVIAHHGNELAGVKLLHPNDHVNMSQSSNDTFPTAMHISASLMIINDLLPSLENAIEIFENLEKENEGIIKSGRTHLQDATPIAFSQEISAWKHMLVNSRDMIKESLEFLKVLAIGGTAVGTGLNAPSGFGVKVTEIISEITGIEYRNSTNKFHALTSFDALVNAHGSLKSLAANLMKIGNDIRWLASGPRVGIGEITIPENEPGSSIMPGKVNPTQVESLTMIAVQVMANDTAIGIAASQGNFQLNVYMPVVIYNFLQSVKLMSKGLNGFCKNCLIGLKPKKDKMWRNVKNSLMLVTSLAPQIGYDNAASIARYAHENNITLKMAARDLNLLSEEDYDKLIIPEEMV